MRPSPASQSRPSAPERSGPPAPPDVEPAGSRPLVNSIRALTPAGAGALTASAIARSSALGSGLGSEPSCAWAMPAVRARAATATAIAVRRRVERVRSRLMGRSFGRAEKEGGAWVVRAILERTLKASGVRMGTGAAGPLLERGQLDREARARDAHAAAVALGDRAHDREAEAGALTARAGTAPEALEGVRDLLGGQPRSVVGDAEARVLAVALDGDGDAAVG